MVIVIILLFVVGLVWYYATHSNSQKIWRVLGKHPDAVIARIENSPDWCVTLRHGRRFEKPLGVSWIGPFNLIIPSEGRVEFYGKSDTYEKQLSDLAIFIETGRLNH